MPTRLFMKPRGMARKGYRFLRLPVRNVNSVRASGLLLSVMLTFTDEVLLRRWHEVKQEA